MNKSIVVLFLAVGLLSCAPITLDPGIYDCASADKYIMDNITYEESPAWQSPRTTLETGRGDCEDIATLWLYLVNEATGEKGTLWMGWWNGEKYGHAWATCGDYSFYELQDTPDTIIWMDYTMTMITADSPF